MHLYFSLFLIQIPLIIGAPSTNAAADVPACARCQWDPTELKKLFVNTVMDFKDTIKVVKKADGCSEAEFICPENGQAIFNTDEGTFADTMPSFKKNFNTTLVCDGKSPYWTLQNLKWRSESLSLRVLLCIMGVKKREDLA